MVINKNKHRTETSEKQQQFNLIVKDNKQMKKATATWKILTIIRNRRITTNKTMIITNGVEKENNNSSINGNNNEKLMIIISFNRM